MLSSDSALHRRGGVSPPVTYLCTTSALYTPSSLYYKQHPLCPSACITNRALNQTTPLYWAKLCLTDAVGRALIGLHLHNGHIHPLHWTWCHPLAFEVAFAKIGPWSIQGIKTINLLLLNKGSASHDILGNAWQPHLDWCQFKFTICDIIATPYGLVFL